MLSFRRLTVTATAVAALAVPAAAQARPDVAPVAPEPTIDKVSPDARYGVPDESTPTVLSVPRTEVVQADDGFAWGDALIGGGAVLILTAAIGGAAVAIRPHHSAAAH